MHWTTELLNKYKEALVAFDTDYVTGYHFLRENNLNRGICKAITGWTCTGTIRYVSGYTRRVTKGLYLADMPVVLNSLGKFSEIPVSIKTRMQHLHKMREELAITEPLF